jgi:hypothetical protein
MSEIALCLTPRNVLLRKEDLTRSAFRRPPDFDAALQGAQLRLLKTIRRLPAQVIKDRLGFQTGIAFEQLLDLAPDFGEGVNSRAVIARWSGLTRRVGNLPPFPRGFLIHPGFGRSHRQAFSRL